RIAILETNTGCLRVQITNSGTATAAGNYAVEWSSRIARTSESGQYPAERDKLLSCVIAGAQVLGITLSGRQREWNISSSGGLEAETRLRAKWLNQLLNNDRSGLIIVGNGAGSFTTNTDCDVAAVLCAANADPG